MDHTTEGRRPMGSMIAIVGGALLAVGSFLPWAKVSGGGQSVSATGIDGTDGWITLVAGVVAIAAGIALMRAAKRGLAILLIVMGLIGGGVGLYDAVTAEDSAKEAIAEEAAAQSGITTEQASELLDQLIAAGELDLSISISFGLYVVIAGGLVALVGGIMSLGGSRGGTGAVAMPSPAASAVGTTPPTAPLRDEMPGTPPPPQAPPGSAP